MVSRKTLLTFIVLLSGVSCSDEKITVQESDNLSNFDQIFDTFWQKMNSNYVYWDVDTTDWDEVYANYKPLFHQLDISNNADRQKSIDYFERITAGLTDCHYNIVFGSKFFSNNPKINPGFVRKQTSASFRAPFNFQPVVVRYLDAGYLGGADIVSKADSQGLSTLAGTIGEDILYFTSSSMYLKTVYAAPSANSKKVLDFFFAALAKPENLKGVIIDLRFNNGGELADLNFVAGRFVGSQSRFGYTHYKANSNRLDFTPWIGSYVNPVENAQASKLPVIVLVDSFTASTAELIAYVLQSLPGGILVGERTYGALGPKSSFELYNSGSFNVGDFMTVQTSSAAFKTLDGRIREGLGFEPDINIQFDAGSIAKGVDIQLERAIQELRK
jgi:carboxyl-terminal processing protease